MRNGSSIFNGRPETTASQHTHRRGSARVGRPDAGLFIDLASMCQKDNSDRRTEVEEALFRHAPAARRDVTRTVLVGTSAAGPRACRMVSSLNRSYDDRGGRSRPLASH